MGDEVKWPLPASAERAPAAPSWPPLPASPPPAPAQTTVDPSIFERVLAEARARADDDGWLTVDLYIAREETTEAWWSVGKCCAVGVVVGGLSGAFVGLRWRKR